MDEDHSRRWLHGLTGGALGALIGTSYRYFWANGIDWGVVGIAGSVGLVLGLVQGNSALRWRTDVLDWS